jgi:ergothioneine biosynthesis protein EgtB
MSRLPQTNPELATSLRDARACLLAMVEDLSDAQLVVPHEWILNPFLWELGHVAWFAERFLLLRAGQAPLRTDANELWDSIAIEHDTRWDLRLPTRQTTLDYMQQVLQSVLERLEGDELPPAERELFQLALFHEDMHVEAFAYMRQTMAYPKPPCEPARPTPGGGPCPGEIELDGGEFLMGALPDAPHAFDNERGAHPVTVAPFALARAPVTQAQFEAFVADGGYSRRELWSAEGWSWRERARAEAPVYWRREAGQWQRRVYDRWLPLEPHVAVVHVNAHEAEAWCRWAGRRLPTEAEWEFAAGRTSSPWGAAPWEPERAVLDLHPAGVAEVGACPAGDTDTGLRQMCGNLWEWTATDFGPYPDFRAGEYAEYSVPWFEGHRALRGGSWATRGRMARNTLRYFYLPWRRDVWCGFRPARDLD